MTEIIHNLECDEETEEEVRQEAVTLLSNGSVLVNSTVLPHQAYCFIRPNTVKICRARPSSQREPDNYDQRSSADLRTEAGYCSLLTILVLTLRELRPDTAVC